MSTLFIGIARTVRAMLFVDSTRSSDDIRQFIRHIEQRWPMQRTPLEIYSRGQIAGVIGMTSHRLEGALCRNRLFAGEEFRGKE